MGAIVAAVNKKRENAVPHVVVMLKELTHRGADAHGIATPNTVRMTKSLDNRLMEKMDSDVALGHNFSSILLQDSPQPVLGNNFSLVFEGRLFPPPRNSETDEIIGRLKPDPEIQASDIIKKLDGTYVFAVALHSKILVGRDIIGANSLYYGENEKICAIASERKALWSLGMKNVWSFPPGNLAIVDASGFTFRPIKTITQPAIKTIDMKSATNHLEKLLLEATRKRVADVDNVTVAFSGGLDSSLVAVLAKLCEVGVHLIWVGLRNQPEVQSAKLAAEALDLPLTTQTYATSDVEQVLPKTLWLIETPDPVKASIAVPFYWVAETASRMKCKVLLAGQGSDELFGGYQRYLKDYAQSITAVREAMYSDVVASHETNFQRDTQVCSFHKVELRLPFTDLKVVKFALSLPLNLKIESPQDALRKRVLRQVAKNLQMPAFIADKRKKAIQYATGVHKALTKLSKKEELNVNEYVKRIFQKVYPIRV